MVAAAHDLEWWLKSDAGLLARVAIGASAFLTLALVDLARRGRAARRWREYLFLVATTGGGMIYGAVNDSITAVVSWEYFYYGKGLAEELGPRTPPDPAALRREAALVGMKAAGSAGLLIGALLLLANNPGRPRAGSPGRPPLPFRRLLALVPGVVLAAVACAAVLGWVGYEGGLAWTSQDLSDAAREGLFRPPRFQCAFGIHLGGYAGGILGLVWALWRIRRLRRRGSTDVPMEQPAGRRGD